MPATTTTTSTEKREAGGTTTTTTTTSTVAVGCCFLVKMTDTNKRMFILAGAIASGVALISSIIAVAVLNGQLTIGSDAPVYCLLSIRNANCGFARFCLGIAIIGGFLLAVLYANRILSFFSHSFLDSVMQLTIETVASGVIAIALVIGAIVVADSIVPLGFSSARSTVSAFSFIAVFAYVVVVYVAFSLMQRARERGPSSGNQTSQPA